MGHHAVPDRGYANTEKEWYHEAIRRRLFSKRWRFFYEKIFLRVTAHKTGMENFFYQIGGNTMKLSFSTLGCPDFRWSDIYSLAKDFGFSGIEMRGLGGNFAVDAAPFKKENLAKTKEKLKKLHLEICCLSSGCALKFPERHDESIAELKEYIALASALGTPYVRVLGDLAAEPNGDFPDEYVIEPMKLLAPIAEEAGVTLLIETNGVYSDSARLADVLAQIGSDNVAALWDWNHPYRFNNEMPETTIKNLGAYIKHCHIKDSVMVDGKVEYRLVGEGDLPPMEQYMKALEDNWQSAPRLRMKARNCPHKYGNGDPVADAYAAELADRFASRVNGRPNGRGGVYKSYMHSARQFINHGKILGATPNGRLAGEELAKNASPCVGMDRNGVTALIRSALALKPSQYHESFCVDVMLHPSAVEGEEGLAVMKALLDTYRKQDGMTMQFNVFSPELLRDAQQNPEKYQNLQVRVCGWNVLWNNMCKEEQDAYILRSENIAD